ncbi:unnamed protein product [Caretta caretta]
MVTVKFHATHKTPFLTICSTGCGVITWNPCNDRLTFSSLQTPGQAALAFGPADTAADFTFKMRCTGTCFLSRSTAFDFPLLLRTLSEKMGMPSVSPKIDCPSQPNPVGREECPMFHKEAFVMKI